MTELFGLSLHDLSQLVGTRALSPVAIVQACLDRIAAVDGLVNAFATLQPEVALAEAKAAEAEIMAGESRGPLHGLPIAHKDLYRTRGLRTTAGSELLKDSVPEADATVVARYRDAGTVLLGKLNTQEFAYGPTNEHSLFGPVLNPWDLACYAGGSSGGSGAALALEMLPAATGSDTGGSIRIPAACCGVTGLKPTYGRLSRHGIYPLCWTMDHPGVMARSARDAAMLLQPIAGADPLDPTTSHHPVPDYLGRIEGALTGVRIGIPTSYFFDRAQSEVDATVRSALDVLADLGAELREVAVPEVDHSSAAAALIYYAEATAYHDDDLMAGRGSLYTSRVHRFLELGNFVLGRDYLQAQRFRNFIGQRFAELLREVDFLVMPTQPITATPMGQALVDIRGVEQPVYLSLLRNTEPFNLAGLPALSVPCGFASNGMPVGMQIAGRAFDEAGVLRIGHAFQEATDWHLRRPVWPLRKLGKTA